MNPANPAAPATAALPEPFVCDGRRVPREELEKIHAANVATLQKIAAWNARKKKPLRPPNPAGGP